MRELLPSFLFFTIRIITAITAAATNAPTAKVPMFSIIQVYIFICSFVVVMMRLVFANYIITPVFSKVNTYSSQSIENFSKL